MNIKLDQYNIPNINIGYVIEDNIQKIRNHFPVRATVILKISNDKLRGTFTVPDAIGFSTPLNLLGPFSSNDMLLIYEDTVESNFYERYIQWKSNFNTKSIISRKFQQPIDVKYKHISHTIHFLITDTKI